MFGTDAQSPIRIGLVVLTLWLALLQGCASPEEFQGTYSEQAPLDADRETAYQLTLFRFGDEVGGVVRFFDLNAPPFRVNKPEEPYGEESHCEFFGPIRLSSSLISFRATDPAGKTHSFRLSSIDDERIDVSVTTFSDESEADEGERFELLRVSQQVDRRCEARDSVSVVARLPELVAEDVTNLSIAVGFVSYQLTDAGQVITLREAAPAVAIPLLSETTWSEEVSVALPEPPPLLSEAGDAVQPDVRYSLGYLVLFDDLNEDGEFRHLTRGTDRVLAVSLEYGFLYLDGPSTGLAPNVADVFAYPDLLPQGYSIQRIETEVAGSNARVTEAVLFGSGIIDLVTVDSALGTFPWLVPELDE